MHVAELAALGPADAAARALGLTLPQQIAAAVPKRQAEYLAGRICARRALQLAGCEGSAEVGTDNDRSPVWPAGYVGSIAHADGTAWAVVAPSRLFHGLGIDLEHIVPRTTAQQTCGTILRSEEQAHWRATGLDFEVYFSLVFSAKESLYKCLYPITRTFFDFQDVEAVAITQGTDRMRLALRRGLAVRFPAGHEFDVHFRIGAEVRTTVYLPVV